LSRSSSRFAASRGRPFNFGEANKMRPTCFAKAVRTGFVVAMLALAVALLGACSAASPTAPRPIASVRRDSFVAPSGVRNFQPTIPTPPKIRVGGPTFKHE
jgi:hypothetical protein